jgi:hypothetical protein
MRETLSDSIAGPCFNQYGLRVGNRTPSFDMNHQYYGLFEARPAKRIRVGVAAKGFVGRPVRSRVQVLRALFEREDCVYAPMGRIASWTLIPHSESYKMLRNANICSRLTTPAFM